jgi:hypothetical protein
LRRTLPVPRAALFAAALAFSVAPPRAGAGDEPAPDAPARSPEERARRIAAEKERRAAEEKAFVASVNAAIDRGKAWLVSQQAGDGTFPGYSRPNHAVNVQDLGVQSLCLLTLVKCGSVESDPELKKGLTALRASYKARKSSGALKTYSAACFVMLLDALYGPPPARRADGDGRGGEPGWRPAAPSPLSPWAAEEIRYVVEHLASYVQDGYWPYPGPPGKGGHEDLSNTQYALLAFQAASRCGVEAPAAVFERALEALLAKQQETGPETPRWVENPAYEPGDDDRYGEFLRGGPDVARGWGYGTKPAKDAREKKVSPTGSMTAAGISSLCIVKDRLRALNALPKDAGARIDRALLDGVAWLGRHFAVDANPGGAAQWLHYYLYGVERAGAYLGARTFGKHDWYREGARFLVGTQGADGGWPGDAEPPQRALDTCFALLFLERATVPPTKSVAPTTTGD